MSEDHGAEPPPEACKATGRESSSQARSQVQQAIQKFAKGITKKLSTRSKRPHSLIPAGQNVDLQDTPSNQNVEDVSHPHPSANKHPASSENPSCCINQGSSREPISKAVSIPSGVDETSGPESVGTELQGAHEASEHMKTLGGRAQSVASIANNALADLAAADNFQTNYLQPLKIFDTAIEKIANVHPYAKMALGVLSAAAKIILAQAKRDESVDRLLQKLDEVYGFITQAENLSKVESMHDIIGKIAQQTLECARFIREYSETKSFWKRVGKNIVAETDDIIVRYNNALDGLMQRFRDQAHRDAAIFVQFAGETLDISVMAYAAGAGLDTTKQCLSGTRTDILSQITEWINSSGDSVPRVMWLSGPAGKGKSAIAHTIANWFDKTGGLGSCFCFDRHREADHRHEKIFSTIARDLADRDPGMKRALADAVKNANSLKNTPDIIQQWRKLLMEPLKKFSASSVGPVLIVIEALDESGGVGTRRNLLRILSGRLQDEGLPQITELPSNFRILVTSRPLHDIEKEFEGAEHVLRLSIDEIPAEVAERDIYAFISDKLKGLPRFGPQEFANLAMKAGGLFEWARLACEYIREDLPGLSPMDCFNAVVNRNPGERKNLLYDMYRLILTEIMAKEKYTTAHYEQAVAKFRSVMGQILAIAEPLPLASLNAMRQHFPEDHDHYEVEVVIKHMGSLLSGTTDSYTPIRPLHATFQEFLTDKSASGDFFVERTKAHQRNLAFASLRVMEHSLCFNICSLKSSYLPNSQDTGLPQRVKTSIPLHLSYSCRYWAVHVQTTDFDDKLAKEIRSLFDDERLMFWIETLGLLNAISGGATVLALIAKWLKGHSGYENLRSSTMDVQRFIQVFGGIILHSTPHLYLSALPFSPVNSTMATKFTAGFPNNLRLASGRDLNWTVVQAVINGHTEEVNSIAFSPDGTRIASGSEDNIVRLWDAATGQSLGEPLEGHTGAVLSVSFSPDSTRIVSGSEDNTIRLWDAATRQPLGEPLEGDTGAVRSVSFSADGTRIASGSWDNTVRLWDVATGQPLGEPLQGHTGAVWSVSFSPDGTRLASGSWDNTVRLWDAVTGQSLGEPLEGHTGAVSSVSFSQDGTRVASGSEDNTTRLWDVVTGQPLGEPLQGHTEAVSSVSFSPDGTRIVSGSWDNTVRLWDAVTGQSLGEPLEGHTGAVLSVSFSPDGTRIASGSWDKTVRLWHAVTRQSSAKPLKGHTGAVSSVSLSPDGTRIASGSLDKTVRLWDVATGRSLAKPLEGHTGAVSSVSFSPDGTRLASGSWDKTVRLWDAVTGQSLGEPLQGHTDIVLAVSFSPDGTRIASGSRDNTVRLWDVATGQSQSLGEPLEGHTGAVWSVSFSPDGTRIASGSRDRTIRLWDVATGQLLSKPLEGDTGAVWSVSFSPDGTRIASGSRDNTVRVWDAVTRQPLGEPLQGHTGAVSSVSFSPDGTRIVSGSVDHTVRLWDVATGRPLSEPLEGHTDTVFSVSFSPDGTRIASGSWDKTVRLWYAMKVQPSPESRESDPSAFPLHRSTAPHTEESCIMPTNICNDRLVSFSSSLEHALPNPADLLEPTLHHNSNSTPFLLQADGWMMGPNHQLLFWVPLAARHAFYTPWTSLVIPRGSPELDMSRMAHGTRWSSCRDAST